MADDIDNTSQYQRMLSWAIIGHTSALYRAIKGHETSCLCRELAVFILDEAGWSIDQFLTYAELVTTDEL